MTAPELETVDPTLDILSDVLAGRRRRSLTGWLLPKRISQINGSGTAAIAAAVLVLAILFAFVGSLFLQIPNAQHPGLPFASPGASGHLLGTDALGRDLLARIDAGAKTTIGIALIVDVIVCIVGVAIGTVAGLAPRRWIEDLIMRLVDLVYSLPGLLMSIVVVFVLGPSARSVIIALSLDGWLVFARLAHGLTTTLRSSGFVEFARLSKCSRWWIFAKHIVPNMASPVLTVATLELARLALAEATLSFLGLGIQPPLVSLGMLLQDGADNMSFAWWLVTFPGIYLVIIILSANVLASWVRSAFDPLQTGG